MSDTRLARKSLFVLISFALIVLLSTTASALSGWTARQNTAHEIAELARSLDLPEDNPIIVEATRLWYEDYMIKPEEKPPEPLYTDADAAIIAKVMYRECGGIKSDTEKACIAWVVLNRVDAGYADTIAVVATAPAQFGYKASTPVRDDLLKLSYDVLERWAKEKSGETEVGRVLPKDYFWYNGDGAHNYFRNAYSGGTQWDYSLTSPYES
jgi:spore germination cell wall hydrolase CwlJ-like protein